MLYFLIIFRITIGETFVHSPKTLPKKIPPEKSPMAFLKNLL
jgi:hypothetical protein